ncbi:MAG: hypothetical protein AAF840_10440 [Bacteroidota bacterium]
MLPIGPGKFQLLTGMDDLIFVDFPAETSPQVMEFRIRESDPAVFSKFTLQAEDAVDPQPFIGTYYADALSVGYRFSNEKGQLVATGGTGQQIRFTPYRKDQFYGDQSPWWGIKFTRDPQGQVTGFRLNIQGVRQTYFRRLAVVIDPTKG